jgi:glycosyltransferase involved in cell wall biosynthesis
MILSIKAIEPKPDFLLCFTTLRGLIGVEAGRRLGIPAVVWIRGESDYRMRQPDHPRQRSLRVWEGAAGVLVQTEKARADLLAELGEMFPKSMPAVREKLAVVGNGVELPPPDEFHPDGPVLSIGRLVPQKGLDRVIDACAQLGRQLIIAGHGPELPALQAQAAALGADVRFAGHLDRDALDELYRKASAMVLVSRHEGLPNVVLEAMAHALPVVATPVGGIPDLVEDGVNGLLVPVGDTAALAAALSRLSADPALARRLGTAARATAEHFAWERVVPNLEDVLERWRRP